MEFIFNAFKNIDLEASTFIVCKYMKYLFFIYWTGTIYWSIIRIKDEDMVCIRL